MIASKASTAVALVSVVQLRKLLSDPPGNILDRLIKAGKISAPDAQGRIDLVQAVPLFFGELRAEMRASTSTAASERARLARAASAELRLAEARRDLIETGDAATAVDHLCGAISTVLTYLPATITRDLGLRRRIERSIHQMHNELAGELGIAGGSSQVRHEQQK